MTTSWTKKSEQTNPAPLHLSQHTPSMKVSPLPLCPRRRLSRSYTIAAADPPQIVSREGAEAYQSATIRGGLQGVGIAGAISVPLHYGLASRSSVYRALPLPAKAFM